VQERLGIVEYGGELMQMKFRSRWDRKRSTAAQLGYLLETPTPPSLTLDETTKAR
jgi:hypothetical protein